MAVKYVVKLKAKQNFSNVRSGQRYTKGKTYVRKLTPKQYSDLRSLNKSKGYAMKQPYTILSVKRK